MAKIDGYEKQDINQQLFSQAKKFMPGGVNSPVRSFKAVGGEPLFIKRASGSRLYSEDNREFIDYCLSWGSLILGHSNARVLESLAAAIKKGTSFGANTKLEIELAKAIREAIPRLEQIRLTNSGTEAVMGAVRLARGYTRKTKIIKFEGSYHGHADYLLVKAGSGMASFGIASSLGVPQDFTKHTLVVAYNNIGQVEEAALKYKDDLAAIIVEPVCANFGVILPKVDFLRGLRAIADRYNLVLIFDEVITGFRLSYGGAQALFDVKPDLTCLGKIIGGGLPIGAFGGKKEIMRLLAPEGDVYQAGTLSGNPIVITAGLTTLRLLREQSPYADLEEKTRKLCQGIRARAAAHNVRIKINYIHSLFSIFFSEEDVVDVQTAKRQNEDLFRSFFHLLLKEGVYLSPSGFEANFLSQAHTNEDLEKTLAIMNKVFSAIGGRGPAVPVRGRYQPAAENS